MNRRGRRPDVDALLLTLEHRLADDRWHPTTQQLADAAAHCEGPARPQMELELRRAIDTTSITSEATRPGPRGASG